MKARNKMRAAEAEAVLRALGPQLTWEESWAGDGHGSPFHSELAHVGISPQGAEYNVHNSRGEWRSSRLGRDSSQATYPTLAAAKAACEHHCATGTWPPDAGGPRRWFQALKYFLTVTIRGE